MPIHGVLLTDAELDHTVGLLSLRQADKLRVYGTASVRELLTECGLLPTLCCYTTVDWCVVQPGADFDLVYQDGSPSPLCCRAVGVGAGRLPRYARRTPGTAEAVVGYIVYDRRTGGSAALAPSVAVDDERIVRELGNTRLALVDGTFWDDDEMSRTGRSTARARSMGHIPVNGSEFGSRIASGGAQVVYTHVNNTNPLILHNSRERALLAERGFVVADDGTEFTL